MIKWLRQLFCKHEEVTNTLTISGYGYTEYQIKFCCSCSKALVTQTQEQK